MPCYNAAKHLTLSVSSVQAQTRSDWELVVVNDGSKDESWTVLQQLARQDPRIRCFDQANGGASSARNHGLREANGTYIAFLDADDTWEPDFLEALGSALEQAPDVAIAYCGWQNLGLAGGRGAPFVPPDYENKDKVETLLEGCRWPIHAAMFPATLVERHGDFDESLVASEDYDLWLRIATRYPLIRVPRVLSYYHHHDGEHITSDHARAALFHLTVQSKFIQAHPEVVTQLGRAKIQKLTVGALMHRGFERYWQRDLAAARRIFREVMKRRYGRLREWKYMLPSLLPEAIHRTILKLMG